MTNWEEPPDPKRPPLPYKTGFVVNITEHEPPPPFGTDSGYPKSTRPNPPRDWMRRTPQSQQVLSNPPQHTQWPSRTPPRSAVLTVKKTISNREGSGAQVVVCEVIFEGKQQPRTFVAKIYDSLYYDLHDPYISEPQDVGWLADKDYSREASAYRHLQQTKQWQKPGFTPEFYGSWTFELPLTLKGKQHKRSVRLILIEHLAGSSLLALYKNESRAWPEGNAFHLDEQYRLGIMAELLEGIVAQLNTGLRQRDIHPRNVMVVPSPEGTAAAAALESSPRVVLIDYNGAAVQKYTKYASWHRQNSRPINPAEAWWTYRLIDFVGWLPAKWHDMDEESGPTEYFSEEEESGWGDAQRWLWKTFVETHPERFEPIQKKLEFGMKRG